MPVPPTGAVPTVLGAVPTVVDGGAVVVTGLVGAVPLVPPLGAVPVNALSAKFGVLSVLLTVLEPAPVPAVTFPVASSSALAFTLYSS